MFTGVVQTTGVIRNIGKDRLSIEAPELIDQLFIGSSVAVNGACLTVIAIKGKEFTADVMPETFQKTNLGLLNVNDLVSLELPLSANGRFEGHMMLGHVEGVGEIKDIHDEGNSKILTIRVSRNLGQFIVPKGSIAMDGISLTVIEAEDTRFSVGIIPHTWKHTHLRDVRIGDRVNIETDIIAKYIKKWQR